MHKYPFESRFHGILFSKNTFALCLAQTSLLSKLSADQLALGQQLGQVVNPVQLQQQQQQQHQLQAQQQQPQNSGTPIFLSGQPLPQAPLLVSGHLKLATSSDETPAFTGLSTASVHSNPKQQSALSTTAVAGNKTVKLEAMGPPATVVVPKPQQQQQVTSSAASSATVTNAGPGFTNGVISRTMSLPSSPMDATDEQQKFNVQRCGSNPFLLKEPPRYDEAIKNKQHQTVSPKAGSMIDNLNNNSSNNNGGHKSSRSLNGVTKNLNLSRLEADMKSQAMDDVLEILIRNGDLPPCAANEAVLPLASPALSKTSMSSSTALVNPVVTSSTSLSPSYMSLHSSLAPSPPPALAVSPPVGSPSNFMMQGVSGHQEQQHDVTYGSPGLFSDVGQETGGQVSSMSSVPSPSQPQVSNQPLSSTNYLSLQDGTTPQSDLLDWGMMLPSPDLSNMDWSQDPGFGNLDQGEAVLGMDPSLLGMGQSVSQLNPHDLLGLEQLMESSSGNQDAAASLSSSVSSGLHTPSGPGSQLDLSGPPKSVDNNDNCADQMDMSDWLDVLMPGPPSVAPHSSYSVPQTSSVDPILTPRTQQDVFDIFNFDDPDFGSSAMTWDRLTEQSTS
ncbi:MKL/myocardin-like protein 2 isoform X1 [Elysia marginata]|uniref:MKL/myocardin-like protein 2 isoform X1 n=1 Tax=Elysia marginata TaxID=1093978 RepID=A0AAV4IAA9_9GAST|nr:MKL/myocardin-like protein 2 isoform X1 [Elysia marginata]